LGNGTAERKKEGKIILGEGVREGLAYSFVLEQGRRDAGARRRTMKEERGNQGGLRLTVMLWKKSIGKLLHLSNSKHVEWLRGT